MTTDICIRCGGMTDIEELEEYDGLCAGCDLIVGSKSQKPRYHNACGDAYEAPNRHGFHDLPVLQFLWGQPLDDLAWNFIHSLKPNWVRVIPHNGEETLDARQTRVTITLREDGLIRQITQECEVGLVGAENGHGLWQQMLERLSRWPR